MRPTVPGGILYAGDYVREEIQAGGLTIDFYYGRKHQAVMEAGRRGGGRPGGDGLLAPGTTVLLPSGMGSASS